MIKMHALDLSFAYKSTLEARFSIDHSAIVD